MFNRFRMKKSEKGQGLTEYVLIFAFVAGIAFMMFGGNGSLKGTLVDTITKTYDILAGLFSEEKTYADYFNRWRDTPLAQLKNESSGERLKADQEALALLARAFIGRKADGEGGVKELMQSLTAGEHLKKLDKFADLNGDGYSDATLVPLSYQLYNLDGENGYTWLDTDNNVATMGVLTNDAVVYRNQDVDNPERLANNGHGRTIVQDRIFYSDGMISDNGQRTINLRLHYDSTGTVDSVDITARKGKYNGTIANGLNLHVTESTYTQNDKDYVSNPTLPRN